MRLNAKSSDQGLIMYHGHRGRVRMPIKLMGLSPCH